MIDATTSVYADGWPGPASGIKHGDWNMYMAEDAPDAQYRCSRCSADDAAECDCYTIDKHLDELVEDGWIEESDLASDVYEDVLLGELFYQFKQDKEQYG